LPVSGIQKKEQEKYHGGGSRRRGVRYSNMVNMLCNEVTERGKGSLSISGVGPSTEVDDLMAGHVQMSSDAWRGERGGDVGGGRGVRI